MSIDIRHIRAGLEELLDSIEAGRLPTPQSIHIGDKLDMSWMLQDDLTGTRQVINDFSGWTVHPAYGMRDTILKTETEYLEVTLWAHPDAVSIKVEVR